MDDEECTDEKPAQEQECINNPCEGVEYVESSWSGVSEIQAWLSKKERKQTQFFIIQVKTKI